MQCAFVSDLHGKLDRYHKLISYLRDRKPDALFVGGDLLPHAFRALYDDKYGEIKDFIADFLIPAFSELKNEMGNAYPNIFIIFGNDDPKIFENQLMKGEEDELWQYLHNRKVVYQEFSIFGYANVPPTPFQLKDWEVYDVSRFVDPGCIPPTAGRRSVPAERDIEYATIKEDLDQLTRDQNLEKAIFLFHSPPYQSRLDRANLDGQYIDHVPLDVHVGSIAIQRFIQDRQPYITLHGHVHESSSLTGSWFDKIGETCMFSAAYEKKELAIVAFNANELEKARRIII